MRAVAVFRVTDRSSGRAAQAGGSPAQWDAAIRRLQALVEDGET